MPAADLFEVATIGGARALGLDVDIGSIEVGKYADLAVLDLRRAHAAGPEDVYTRLVYSARASDVRLVTVGGKVVVENGVLTAFDEADAVAEAETPARAAVKRAVARGLMLERLQVRGDAVGLAALELEKQPLVLPLQLSVLPLEQRVARDRPPRRPSPPASPGSVSPSRAFRRPSLS